MILLPSGWFSLLDTLRYRQIDSRIEPGISSLPPSLLKRVGYRGLIILTTLQAMSAGIVFCVFFVMPGVKALAWILHKMRLIESEALFAKSLFGWARMLLNQLNILGIVSLSSVDNEDFTLIIGLLPLMILAGIWSFRILKRVNCQKSYAARSSNIQDWRSRQ